MATYCIGDIHGCLAELQALLQLIKFNPTKDRLYFVGDLVNRGPYSLEVLRLIKSLPHTTITLGNHDLHLLELYYQVVDFESEHLKQIFQAPDCLELITWLKKQPLLCYDKKFNALITHAGIYPQWNLPQALQLAAEAEQILQSGVPDYLHNMYGDEPHTWHNQLQNYDRFRFIINAFTRMRFCTPTGQLNFTHQGITAPPNYLPWFEIPERQCKNIDIIFGHWAAKQGQCDTSHVYAIDTGCVWGGSLTALRLEDKKIFQVKSKTNIK